MHKKGGRKFNIFFLTAKKWFFNFANVSYKVEILKITWTGFNLCNESQDPVLCKEISQKCNGA